MVNKSELNPLSGKHKKDFIIHIRIWHNNQVSMDNLIRKSSPWKTAGFQLCPR